MRNWKRWLILGGAAIVGLGILYILFTFVFLDFFVNLWWYDSLNLKGYYLLRLFYRYLVFFAAWLMFFLIFFLNFWAASRYLGASTGGECTVETIETSKKHRRLLALFQSGSLKVYTPLSMAMAIPISATVYEKWNDVLLAVFAPRAGVTDPVYGKDVSFYLFTYPISSVFLQKFLIAFSVLFLALTLLYWIENRVLCRNDKNLPKGARMHLSVVGGVIIFFIVSVFMLQRYQLLYTDAHEPLFYGPGFIEMWIDLPLIWAGLVSFVATSVSLLFWLHRRKGLKLALVAGAVFLMVMGLRNTTMLAEMVDKYIVKPNEAAREKPYIERSIKATLDAFNLQEVEIMDFSIRQSSDFLTDDKIKEALHNIPIWDRELLDDVFQQLQGFRTYYNFADVDVGRYTVEDVYQQVYLGARELSMTDLPESARNWNNMHLQYSHGYGVVMTPAVQGGDEPMTWFIRDIPIASDYGLAVKQPRIYYGLQSYPYVIVPNDLGEIDHPQTEAGDELANYDGAGGVPVASAMRKIIFSIYFKDRNIFFTTKTNRDSRMLFRQNILEAIAEIAPFLVLDDDPYIVATNEGLFWMLDAYTYSDMYPNARKFTEARMSRGFIGKPYNYVRNSVTIVADAYNGSISFYIADPDDPIVKAYDRMYPGLFKQMAAMPADLKPHTRYPRDLFSIQMAVYAKYHQTEPEQFYQDEDTWQFASSLTGPVTPYYVTLDLKNWNRQHFLLMSPMSPLGRDNLRALVIAECDGDNYGKMTAFSFPRGQQVFGPSQISALINQDTDIAQEVTLWDQAGSEVRFGRVLMLPVGQNILYLQPVYIRSSTRLKIPELKRIIVSQGEIVAMDRTIEEALEKLQEKIRDRNERMQRRLPMTPRNGETPTPAGHGESS